MFLHDLKVDDKECLLALSSCNKVYILLSRFTKVNGDRLSLNTGKFQSSHRTVMEFVGLIKSIVS